MTCSPHEVFNVQNAMFYESGTRRVVASRLELNGNLFLAAPTLESREVTKNAREQQDRTFLREMIKGIASIHFRSRTL